MNWQEATIWLFTSVAEDFNSGQLNNNNNNNLFIYSALFNMLGDQKCITTINNLKTINTNIKITENKSSKWLQWDSNLGPSDCEPGALTTQPCCLIIIILLYF